MAKKNPFKYFKTSPEITSLFRLMRSLQKFAAVHGLIHNYFNKERHLYSRSFLRATEPPLAEWQQFAPVTGD